jgi:outer membrane lipoprotein SlyB
MNEAPLRWGPALIALAMSACSTSSPDVVGRGEVQRLSSVVDAVVLSTRAVVVEGSQSGVGSTAGGLIGGITGSTVGGQREAMAVGVLGAVVGGVMGNVVERSITREPALEILVQLNNGDRRAVVQALAAETFTPGDAVVLVSTGGKVRVTRAAPPTAPPAPPPATPPAAITPAPGKT